MVSSLLFWSENHAYNLEPADIVLLSLAFFSIFVSRFPTQPPSFDGLPLLHPSQFRRPYPRLTPLMKRKAVAEVHDFFSSDCEDDHTSTTTVTVEQFSADRRRILQVQQEEIHFVSSKPSSTPPDDIIYHDLSAIVPNQPSSAKKKMPARRYFVSVSPRRVLIASSSRPRRIRCRYTTYHLIRTSR